MSGEYMYTYIAVLYIYTLYTQHQLQLLSADTTVLYW